MIKGFVGTYGTGKTLWLTNQAQWYFSRGYRVISNMPIWGYYKRQKVMAEFIYNDQIFDFLKGTLFQEKQTLLIVDEASGIFDSYKFKTIPQEVFDMLKQSRKIKLDIYYTSQRHQDIATRVRDNSSIIYICDQIRLPFLRIYRATGVDPYYFQDKAQSGLVKYYIKKRRLAFAFNMKKYYKHYSTEFVITTKDIFLRYEKYLDDPEKITPEKIIDKASRYKEVVPPL